MDEKHPELKKIFATYWPLAVSWLFMAVDTPAITAVVSRMNDPQNVLAAHGMTYPVILLIEAPVINLISTSLALCCDRKNYQRVRKLMICLCGFVTFMHALICVPQVFDLIIVRLLGAPAELRLYSHQELLFVIPWSGFIGYRRFCQGVLIRNGYSRKVTLGTAIRMFVMLSSLFVCLRIKQFITGAQAAGFSLSISVICEAVYNGIEENRAVRESLSKDKLTEPLISWNELIAFVTPLILTAFVNNIWQFIGSAAVSRMIEPVVSLAVWPVMSSLLTLIKCFGNAINETALALLPAAGMRPYLKRFTLYVSAFCFGLFLIFALPPANQWWFATVSSLAPDLVRVSKKAFPLVALLPLMTSAQNYCQAELVYGKRTRPVFESLLVFLCVMLVVLGIGIAAGRWMGIYVIMVGMGIATTGQTFWLYYRAKQLEKQQAAAAM